MSEHQPSCAETGERMHVAFEIFYDVVHASPADARAVAQAVKGAMHRTGEVQHGESITKAGEAAYTGDDKTGFVPVYDVTVEGEVERVLDRSCLNSPLLQPPALLREHRRARYAPAPHSSSRHSSSTPPRGV
jgi:hypothetical protein